MTSIGNILEKVAKIVFLLERGEGGRRVRMERKIYT
jgi:hypothetical protein